MNTLDTAGYLNGKKVLLRTDFDVPVGEDGIIQESYRIKRQEPCIRDLMARGAEVTLIAHITSVPSFKPLMPQIEEILGIQNINLLENLRVNPGEEANDADFARKLADGFDIYVNNAFAVSHRAHASVATLPKLLPSYAGPLIVEETSQLAKFIDAPAEGKIVYVGGAKASTKVPVIKYLIDKAQKIAVGGVAANDILAGTTDVDAHDARLCLPADFIFENGVALDIGPQASMQFADLASGAKLVAWNGPMGKFEDSRFMAGTKAVAEGIVAGGAFSIVGGGDTVSAVDKLGLLDKFGFVSTGGGAMLDFMAGVKLPGLVALEYYND